MPSILATITELTASAQSKVTLDPIELFRMGGWVMWMILLLSIVASIVILYCLFYTRSREVVPTRLVEQVELSLRNRNYMDVSSLCDENDSNFARVMYVVATFLQRNPGTTEKEVTEVANAEGSRQANALTRPISWLADIGSLAPMMGLLGTVLGMMRTFFEISTMSEQGGKQIQMAGGVAEALITTAGGLMLGIPVMIAYVYFRSRVSKRIGDLEAAITHSVTLVTMKMQ